MTADDFPYGIEGFCSTVCDRVDLVKTEDIVFDLKVMWHEGPDMISEILSFFEVPSLSESLSFAHIVFTGVR